MLKCTWKGNIQQLNSLRDKPFREALDWKYVDFVEIILMTAENSELKSYHVNIATQFFLT